MRTLLIVLLLLAGPAVAQEALSPYEEARVILSKISELAATGVAFDDEGSDGYIPALHIDGRYHMACIDLVLVSYRAAGYDFIDLMNQRDAPELGPTARKISCHPVEPKVSGKPEAGVTGPARSRSIVRLIEYLKSSSAFHYYDGQNSRPLDREWKPRMPFRIGDIVFLHYIDGPDRHSGIVTRVDPLSGLPAMVAQISPYNKVTDLQQTTLPELFRLKCRRLTGYARPARWDQE